MDFKKFLFVIAALGVLVFALGCVGGGSDKSSVEEKQIVDDKVVEQDLTVVEIKPAVPASAKEWYLTAKDRALAWQTDAKIVGIQGNNIDGSAYLPVNGKSLIWKYTFVSVLTLKSIELTVENGAITGEKVNDEALAKGMYGTAPGESGLVIDSDTAVAKIVSLEDTLNFIQNFRPNKVNYVFVEKGMSELHSAYWSITYLNPGIGSSFVKEIDSKTGNIL